MDIFFLTYICSNCISIGQTACKDAGQLLEPKLWQIVQTKLRKKASKSGPCCPKSGRSSYRSSEHFRAPIHRSTANKNCMECRSSTIAACLNQMSHARHQRRRLSNHGKSAKSSFFNFFCEIAYLCASDFAYYRRAFLRGF